MHGGADRHRDNYDEGRIAVAAIGIMATVSMVGNHEFLATADYGVYFEAQRA